VRLFLGENVDEFVEISDTSANKQLEQLTVAVTWLVNVENVFSLLPRDTSGIGKVRDKRNISVNKVQQLYMILIQRVHPSFV